MAIALTPAQRAMLRSGALKIRTLVDVHLDSGRCSFWDGEGAWSTGDTTYLPAAEFGEISTISAGADLGAEGMEMRLNGSALMRASPEPSDPRALFATLEQEDYQLRRVDVTFAFFDGETDELVLLMRRYAGFIDQVRQTEEIAEGGSAEWLIFALESIVRRYGVRGARTRSHEDQQEIWPGDTFFKFTAPSIATQSSRYWGRKSPATAAPGGGVIAAAASHWGINRV